MTQSYRNPYLFTKKVKPIIDKFDVFFRYIKSCKQQYFHKSILEKKPANNKDNNYDGNYFSLLRLKLLMNDLIFTRQEIKIDSTCLLINEYWDRQRNQLNSWNWHRQMENPLWIHHHQWAFIVIVSISFMTLFPLNYFHMMLRFLCLRPCLWKYVFFGDFLILRDKVTS